MQQGLLELAIITIILLLNLLTMIVIKTRATTIITIIIANLITILLYSLVINNYEVFKTLVITTVIYSAAILAVISNNNSISKSAAKSHKKTKINKFSLLFSFIFTLVLIITIGVFYLTKNINQISSEVAKQQIAVAHTVSVASDIIQIAPEQKKITQSSLFRDSNLAIIIIIGTTIILLLNFRHKKTHL